MSRSPGTRAEHEKFCRVEGWRRVRNARGRTGSHHVTYELALPDTRVLRTRISHPVDPSTYGPRLWQHILRDQLEVDEDGFWRCVREGVPPERGLPAQPEEALPADLMYLLVHRVGLRESEIAVMSRTEAIEALRRYWSGE
ncbi:hypothetical protein [Saccharomonospora iraqiensis]|uniref:hypothetical protein n=1 Tax=Saccharomonospora iraqiensis TaxID=52698 RepID=UPI00022E11FE|nr:hypothetical protein [Saccharomonospora iraqiensis]